MKPQPPANLAPKPRRSLSARLFRAVFGFYLLVAVSVTLLQMRSEYHTAMQSISDDVNNLAVSFSPALSAALWTLNDSLLDAVLLGLDNISFITGYEIRDTHGTLLRGHGMTPAGTAGAGNTQPAATKPPSAPAPRFDFMPAFTFTLQHADNTGKTWGVGSATFHVANDVVISRVLHSFMLILVNAAVKTAALWLIFLLVAKRLLHKPLASLAEQMQQVDTDSVGSIRVDMNAPSGDELESLGHSFNQMLDKLATAHTALQRVNQDLELRVQTRTERLSRVNANLLDLVELNNKIFATSSIGILATRTDGSVIFANQGLARMVGGTVEQVLLQNVRMLRSWQSSGLLATADDVMRDGQTREITVSMHTIFDKHVWVQATMSRFLTKGEPHLLTVYVDITDLKEAELRLVEQSRVDSLTRCLNRRAFMERGDEELGRAQRHRRPLTALMMDIDYFKRINDKYGHAAGDRALVVFATRVRAIVRSEDIFARIGGEEFCLLLPDTDTSQALQLAERIRATTQAISIPVDGGSLGFTLSIGIAASDAPRCSLDQLLMRADKALYEAKAEGRNRVWLSGPEDETTQA